MVTERMRRTELYDALLGRLTGALQLIGDAASPGLIADAVWSGHNSARNFERPVEETDADQYIRELVSLSPWEKQ